MNTPGQRTKQYERHSRTVCTRKGCWASRGRTPPGRRTDRPSEGIAAWADRRTRTARFARVRRPAFLAPRRKGRRAIGHSRIMSLRAAQSPGRCRDGRPAGQTVDDIGIAVTADPETARLNPDQLEVDLGNGERSCRCGVGNGHGEVGLASLAEIGTGRKETAILAIASEGPARSSGGSSCLLSMSMLMQRQAVCVALGVRSALSSVMAGTWAVGRRNNRGPLLCRQAGPGLRSPSRDGARLFAQKDSIF